MTSEKEFFSEINRLLAESARALRSAEPLAVLQASEALSQLMSKWHRSEFVLSDTAELKTEVSQLENLIDQLKLQQLQLRQQKAQIEKQLKVLLPGWSNDQSLNSSGERSGFKTLNTSVRA